MVGDLRKRKLLIKLSKCCCNLYHRRIDRSLKHVNHSGNAFGKSVLASLTVGQDFKQNHEDFKIRSSNIGSKKSQNEIHTT